MAISIDHHQRIQHLQQLLESWGPSNHRSHVGLRGPTDLSNPPKKNCYTSKIARGCNINKSSLKRSYDGSNGSGFVSTLMSILAKQKPDGNSKLNQHKLYTLSNHFLLLSLHFARCRCFLHPFKLFQLFLHSFYSDY